jgi:hypothetical protein
MLRIPHRLDSRLTHAGEAASLMRAGSALLLYYSGTYFCWRLGKPLGPMWMEVLGKLTFRFIAQFLDQLRYRVPQADWRDL